MEGLLSTNKYNLPKVLEGKEEVSVLIIRLLLLEPGTNPLHPEMGAGLLQRYKNCSTEDIPDLELEIKNQITTYLPDYQQADVKVKIENSILRLSIQIDDTLYNFTTSDNPEPNELSLTSLK